MNGVSAEVIVLGMLLIDPSLHDSIDGAISGSDFNVARNRHLFEGIKPDKLDLVGAAGLVNDNRLKKWSTVELASLIDIVHTPSVFASAVKIMRTRSVRKSALQSASSIISAINDGDGIEDVRIYAEDILSTINGSAPKKGLVHISSVAEDVLKSLNSDRNRYVKSGFKSIDRLITGFFNKDFIILAARPSVGKTALAANIAYNVAEAGYPVAFFSLEMSDRAIVERTIATYSGLNLEKIRSGKIYDPEKPRLSKTVDHISKLPIFIDDRGGQSIKRIHAEAKEFKRKHQGKLIILDYLQLAKGKGGNNNERVSSISSNIKDMAKDLDMPVIALSQLNRGLKDRANKRPELSDLRDSGALEQDSDLIMFLHRDDYYDGERLAEAPVELLIAKQRGGNVGTANLFFDGAAQKFK